MNLKEISIGHKICLDDAATLRQSTKEMDRYLQSLRKYVLIHRLIYDPCVDKQFYERLKYYYMAPRERSGTSGDVLVGLVPKGDILEGSWALFYINMCVAQRGSIHFMMQAIHEWGKAKYVSNNKHRKR